MFAERLSKVAACTLLGLGVSLLSGCGYNPLEVDVKPRGEPVYNYTQNHKTTRESVQVGVAYGSDTKLVEKILLECAAALPEILKHPKPFVLFE